MIIVQLEHQDSGVLSNLHLSAGKQAVCLSEINKSLM